MSYRPSHQEKNPGDVLSGTDSRLSSLGKAVKKRSAGVAPNVNLRNSVLARKHLSERSTLALKPRADVTRSPKHGHQCPHKKDICLPNLFFFKKENDRITQSNVLVALICRKPTISPSLND